MTEMFNIADFLIDRLDSHFGAYGKAFYSFSYLFPSDMSFLMIHSLHLEDWLRKSISKLTCSLCIYIIPWTLNVYGVYNWIEE